MLPRRMSAAPHRWDSRLLEGGFFIAAMAQERSHALIGSPIYI